MWKTRPTHVTTYDEKKVTKKDQNLLVFGDFSHQVLPPPPDVAVDDRDVVGDLEIGDRAHLKIAHGSNMMNDIYSHQSKRPVADEYSGPPGRARFGSGAHDRWLPSNETFFANLWGIKQKINFKRAIVFLQQFHR